MAHHPLPYSLVSLVVVVGLTFVYASLDPRYRLADQVPDKQQAVAASQSLDEKLDRRQPDRRAHPVPEGRGALRSPRRSPSSPPPTRSSRSRPASATSGRWKACAAGWPKRRASPTSRPSRNMSATCRPQLTRRFVSEEEDSVVVSGRIPDIDASALLPRHHRARRGAADRSAPRTPATRCRSPALRRSPRATAPP